MASGMTPLIVQARSLLVGLGKPQSPVKQPTTNEHIVDTPSVVPRFPHPDFGLNL